MEISDLPAEMLVQVHQWLPLSDLKEAVLVSRLWRKEGEHPSLWKWCKVTVSNKDDIGNLAIRRIKDIQEIEINPQNWDDEDWQAFFLATMELESLKFIDGLGDSEGLGAVERGIFARALVKLEVVELWQTLYEQIEELFREMAGSTTIKKLHLEKHDLSRMDPDLFAIVLSGLEDVLLYSNKTTNDQIQAFFTQIVEQNCLKRLNLTEESVSRLEPGLFARALSNIEELTLENENLGHDSDDEDDEDDEEDDDDQVQNRTNDQIEALFTELSHGTQMKKLDLDFIDLSQVESRMFANSLSRLQTLGLHDCTVTNDQYQSLFTKMALNTNLKKLEIHWAWNSISSVNPQVLATALNKLDELKMECANLTHDQAETFFLEMARETKLKTLDFQSNLSALDPKIVGTALTKLKEAALSCTRLTREKIEAVLNHVLEEDDSKLRELQWMWEADGVLESLNPETVGMLQDKLGGQFELNYRTDPNSRRS